WEGRLAERRGRLARARSGRAERAGGQWLGLADAAAGRVELDPAELREVHLDPPVRGPRPDDLDPVGAAVARQEAIGDARRDALGAEHDRHRAGVELAVAALDDREALDRR